MSTTRPPRFALDDLGLASPPLTPAQEREALDNLATLGEILPGTPEEVCTLLRDLLTGPDARRVAAWLAFPA